MGGLIMAKVITTITAEDGMDFEKIMSFNTRHYIGIYAANESTFVLLEKSSTYFEPRILQYCYSLKELDDVVFAECQEHIMEVFDNSDYTIELN